MAQSYRLIRSFPSSRSIISPLSSREVTASRMVEASPPRLETSVLTSVGRFSTSSRIRCPRTFLREPRPLLRRLPASVADAAGKGFLLAEVAADGDAAALVSVQVAEHGAEPFLGRFFSQGVAFGRYAHVVRRQALLGENQHRAAIARNVLDDVQLPQLFQQFAYPAGRIARQVREFVLGDGHEVAEQAAVPSQQHRDEVVQLAAVHPDAVQLVALDDETDAGRIVRFVGQDQVAVLLQYLDRLESRRYEKAEPCGEVEHVERERSAPAVADSYA